MTVAAESALQGDVRKGPAVTTKWIYDTPLHSDVEAKLRQLLIELRNDDKILGIQVCAYKDGEVIIDTSAGVLGVDDSRPVQSDTLFPVFSATKGITAGLLHWLADKGKLQLDDDVANIWPEFGTNGKNSIKVHHVLNHTSGLHNALDILRGEDRLVMADWDQCLEQLVMSIPETEPGQEQVYHYFSFGWLCGGIIEQASGKKFQEILEEAIVRPLEIDGELYVGIPPGVESRLATLTLDTDDLKNILDGPPDLSVTFTPKDLFQLATSLPDTFNMLSIRRAIVPAANGHCSARALARYYAALAGGGVIPPPHSPFSNPPLGCYSHIPMLSLRTANMWKGEQNNEVAATTIEKANSYDLMTGYDKEFKDHDNDSSGISSDVSTPDSIPSGDDDFHGKNVIRMFDNPEIHNAFLGLGEYTNLVKPNGKIGLGFRRHTTDGGLFSGFGHSGMGGSTGFCDLKNRFAIAVTLNKISSGTVTSKIIQLVCSELNVPLPDEFSSFEDKGLGTDLKMQID